MKPLASLFLLLAAGTLGAQAVQDYFPMAVWYGGGTARAPMLERAPDAKKETWRKDLRQIKSLGFNTIRCWIDWASGEPTESNYRFDTVDVLLELAEQESLKLVIQVYMDAAPDWVGRKYPDSLFVAAGGEVMRPEPAPGYCFDHAGVQKATLGFFTALARRAAKSPAFLGWDLWSEPHVINWAMAPYLPNAEFCFCPHSVGRFRTWLKKKYGGLDALNAAWYRRFSDWKQVEPGRLSTILSYTDYIDWRTFIQEKLGEDLRMRYEAVKRGAPDRVATSHAAVPSLFTSPLAGDGAPDDWIMARQADYYGTSFYPKHSSPVGRDVPWRAALMDFARSSGKGRGFWVGELQGGFGTIALRVSATVTPDDLRVWTWTALSRGAKGINFYAWYPMSSGYESGGYGLIQLDGTITERSRAAGEIARVVDRNQKLFLDARPPKAEVAIVYNPMVHFVGGRQRAFSSPGAQGEVSGIERDSLLGTYRALFPTNVPVDFVHINEATAAELKPYRLVIFPYPLMMPGRAATELAGYVRAGGALVSEARLGWNNEQGWAAETIPGLGLHEVMGCRETAIQTTPDNRTELTWTADGIPGLKPGDRLPGRLYEETIEPVGAQSRVIAKHTNGAPGAVISSFGAGKTLTIGTYVGIAYEAQQDPAIQRLFTGLLEWAGVTRPVESSAADTEVRWLESGSDRIVFIFHHADKPSDVPVALSMPPGNWTAVDLQSGRGVELTRSGASVRFGKRLGPSEVWVLRLSPT
jgi:beta-galactosidase